MFAIYDFEVALTLYLHLFSPPATPNHNFSALPIITDSYHNFSFNNHHVTTQDQVQHTVLFHATKELLPITDVFKMVTVHTKPPVGLFDVLADLIDGVTGAVLAF
jgi:hypothetical protein